MSKIKTFSKIDVQERVLRTMYESFIGVDSNLKSIQRNVTKFWFTVVRSTLSCTSILEKVAIWMTYWKLEALLTTVRRWGCEALSTLWIHYGNNNCDTSEGATKMMQAKTQTHIKRGHDCGDDCNPETNSTSKHKTRYITKTWTRGETEGKQKLGTPINDGGVDKSNQEQPQSNLNATLD